MVVGITGQLLEDVFQARSFGSLGLRDVTFALNDAEFFPCQSKSWPLAFTVNDDDAPTGRLTCVPDCAGLANFF